MHLQVTRFSHGVPHIFVWHEDFFSSPEYATVSEFGNELNELVGDSSVVSRASKSQSVSSFDEAYRWLLAQARQGLSVQRYKGLGEMNPEQLWETTVNPETRRMLQVSVEDAVAADQIFATLMGDVVEPRREFIEDNALKVSNLDI